MGRTEVQRRMDEINGSHLFPFFLFLPPVSAAGGGVLEGEACSLLSNSISTRGGDGHLRNPDVQENVLRALSSEMLVALHLCTRVKKIFLQGLLFDQIYFGISNDLDICCKDWPRKLFNLLCFPSFVDT